MDASRTGECLRKVDRVMNDMRALLADLHKYIVDNLDSEDDLSHEELLNFTGALSTNVTLSITNLQALNYLLTAMTGCDTIVGTKGKPARE